MLSNGCVYNAIIIFALESRKLIYHIVLVKFRSDVSLMEREAVWAELDALRGVVDGLETAVFGQNISPEGISRGYNDGFVMTFQDVEARDAYLAHPAHQAAGARLVAALDGGMDGLLVVDI